MKFETSFSEILPQTSDVTSFRVQRPIGLSFKPGQYMLCTIKSGEKELIHPFSFSSSPTEEKHIEFTKKFTNSEYSSTLKKIGTGDWARIDAPYGKFTFEGEYPRIALLTGGIGITPFRSIIKYCTDLQIDTDIVAFYGCRSPTDFVFKDELQKLQSKNEKLRMIFTVNQADSNWDGNIGNINIDLVKKELSDYNNRIFFACGPPGMVSAMINLVKDLGLPETQLKLESFVGHE